MIDPLQPPLPGPGCSELADLAERLAKYRSRVEREGRKSALERLDKAIDEAKRKPTPGKSKR